jgi:hypothetical protein
MRMGTLMFVIMLAMLGAAPAIAGRGVDVPLAQPFDLKIGEQVTIAGQGLELGFSEVLSDSRCPRNAQCFWAGAATIRITVEKKPDRRETFTLRLPNSDERVTYGRYSISLKDLKPYPEADRQQRREDYVATLVVTLVE